MGNFSGEQQQVRKIKKKKAVWKTKPRTYQASPINSPIGMNASVH